MNHKVIIFRALRHDKITNGKSAIIEWIPLTTSKILYTYVILFLLKNDFCFYIE